MPEFKIALPTYNVLTDTNSDHFSLIADDDNVLIKEKTRGSVDIAAYDDTTISHNLGYVPLVFVFVKDVDDSNRWKLVPHFQGIGDIPRYYYLVTTSDVTIYNANFAEVTATFKYFIFYDELTSGAPSITESGSIIKATKSGTNALTNTNPNNFVVHSNLNTFKILKEGSSDVTHTAYDTSRHSINHGLSGYSPSTMLLFVQFPDGSTGFCMGTGGVISKDEYYKVSDVYIDSTKIDFLIESFGDGTDFKFKYYILEAPMDSSSGITLDLSEHKIRVAKSGYNALTDTNPDHYTFLSGFNTLKYFTSGSQNITIVGDTTYKQTVVTIPHNLGYVPVFFVEVQISFLVSGYAFVPIINQAGILFDVRGEAWADDTNIYLRMTNLSDGDSITANFVYKIFKNNLGF